MRLRQGPVYMEVVAPPPMAHFETAADVEAFEFPDPLAEGRYDDAAMYIEKYGGEYFVIGDMELSMFDLMHLAVGMEKLLIDMAMGKDYVPALIEKTKNFSLAIGKKLVSMGVDGVWAGDDFGGQNGMLISPRMWRKYFKEPYREIYSELKSVNPNLMIMQHCDGAVAPILGDWIEVGLEVFNPVQPNVPGHEPEDLKSQFGDSLSFWGAIDQQHLLPYGSSRGDRGRRRRKDPGTGRRRRLHVLPGPHHPVGYLDGECRDLYRRGEETWGLWLAALQTSGVLNEPQVRNFGSLKREGQPQDTQLRRLRIEQPTHRRTDTERLRPGQGALRRAGRRHRRRRWRPWPGSPSACTAGRATTSPASRSPDAELSGGIAATGNYPGKARNADELRGDLDMAYSLIPGTHRLNLHAIYAETGGKQVERNELQPEHFAGWVDWARDNDHGLDFNPTFFSHPLADDGFTLASYDAGVRQFWIEHCIACRKIGEHFGRELGTPCVTNIWIPDGFKDTPVDRKTPRRLLKESLDAILAERIEPSYNLDAVECKLFGLGSESYVVGSHEFYLGYAVEPIERAALPGQRAFPPHRGHLGQALGGAALCRRGAAARQPRRALGQRPRGHPHRRAAGHHAGDRARRLPGAGAHRPGLFRRQHQPRGGLDHRHAQRAAGPAAGPAGAHRDDARDGAWRRLFRPAGAAGRTKGPALWRGLGLPTACSRMCRLALASWTRSRPTRSRN